jgi:purine-binding chemotaxis protein CheW
MSELFLIAHVAGRAIAIDADQVASVVDIGQVVSVPRASGVVRGLAALRSRVVTVIDTQAALGHGAAGTPGRAVIACFEGHFYAFLVDALEDVAPFERTHLSSGMALDHGWGSCAAGVIERDGEPLLVVDLVRLVPMPIAA